MNYSLTFVAEDYESLISALFTDRSHEQAAYLRCGVSESEGETRLLVRTVEPVDAAEIIDASPGHMVIASSSFMRMLKKCDHERTAFVFVHSHPPGYERHSSQDDLEELKLFHTAHTRIERPTIHASLVLSDPTKPIGRVWLADGTTRPVSRIRVIGDRFRFYDDVPNQDPTPQFFDRQVRAFGADIQLLLGRMTAGVVGSGGTGSATIEQLIRLGIGTIITADGQRFEQSNVNRVYGSSAGDEGAPKIEIMERLSTRIGVGTRFIGVDKPIYFQSAIATFRECDIIFGCTDEEWGRSLLSRFAIYYYIPVFDVAAKIDSEGGVIQSVQGRVTTLLPGSACMYCRGRISSRHVYLESVQALAPKEADQLRREGYAPELADPAPAVIPFTTAVAAGAINELIHRLTGYMGRDRRSTEVLYRFDSSALSTNSRPPEPECFLCSQRKWWGRGDRSPLLDVVWRPET
jgi:molybdopterin/thiamine biosynthesis adenylyltransferase